ncbi:uncharacterized protein LOC127787476 [Diospyros lotus]|uniref:uncharacterized protein LOC127787476 n=1 Tax=Diospyros lotus TaxID=55363 RepID=UPI00224E491E|nr:uncharacterized protein LOC127787476 [Diospyros lotus]
MDCLVLPAAILKRRLSGYRHLSEESSGDSVTVVTGKERREFVVDPFVLEENPFRIMIDLLTKKGKKGIRVEMNSRGKRVIFVDVDTILFEHMLWLMNNDFSSFLQLNHLKEIIEFYAQDG